MNGLKEIFSDEPLIITANLKDMDDRWKRFRVFMLGLPADPVRHKHFSRKTFKKALMAHRWERNKAEYMCQLVANSNGVLSYDQLARSNCPWIFA